MLINISRYKNQLVEILTHIQKAKLQTLCIEIRTPVRYNIKRKLAELFRL